MKHYHLLSALLLTAFAQAQKLEATYNVSCNLSLAIDKKSSNSIRLDYEGHLYKDKGQHIYFQRPLFLDQYPKGDISIPTSKGVSSVSVCIDTFQRICYNNTDSMICRGRDDQSELFTDKGYRVRTFELGVHQWELLPESKEISGLQCQRARQYYSSDSSQLMWDVWFCPAIDIQFGPGGIRDIPGLVVEATNYMAYESYKLTSYTTQSEIPASTFWLPEFNTAKFRTMSPLVRRSGTQKTEAQKRSEIVNQ